MTELHRRRVSSKEQWYFLPLVLYKVKWRVSYPNNSIFPVEWFTSNTAQHTIWPELVAI